MRLRLRLEPGSMRLWLGGLWRRRRLASRQPAQDLVEFGVIVAAVSILGIAGLNVLGRAEEGYFIPLSSVLAPQAPVGTDDVVHPTVVNIHCTPTTVTLPGTTSCTFTVTDNWPTRRTWPQGTVQLAVNGGIGSISCTLVRDTSSSDPAQSTCPPVSWTPDRSNIPSASLSAHYAPGDGTHAASTSNPPQTIVVQVQVTAAFTTPPGQTTPCWNPLGIFPGSPEQVEVGHPLICHVTVKDSLGQLYPSTPVTVSEVANPPDGEWFSCFTNNNRSAYTQCNPAGHSFSGTTDTNGELTFVYRHYYDTLSTTVADTLTTSTSYSGSSQTHVVTIAPATATHRHLTETLVKCSSFVSTGGQFTWTSRSGLVVESDVQLVGPAGVSIVTCTIAVYDSDPSYTTGNPDIEDGYSPSGLVTLKDDVGQVFGSSCALKPGNAIGPPYLPLQISALPDYASACPITFSISGAHKLTASYAGDTAGEHNPSSSPQIDADFP